MARFLQKQHGKMIVISSQETTIIDCNNGKIEECEIVYDEQELVAYCERLSNEELCIVGQFGGKLPDTTVRGERVIVKTNDEHIMKIYFASSLFDKTLIYDCYDAYLCGFSYDDDYFVLADDAGIIILKRKS